MDLDIDLGFGEGQELPDYGREEAMEELINHPLRIVEYEDLRPEVLFNLKPSKDQHTLVAQLNLPQNLHYLIALTYLFVISGDPQLLRQAKDSLLGSHPSKDELERVLSCIEEHQAYRPLTFKMLGVIGINTSGLDKVERLKELVQVVEGNTVFSKFVYYLAVEQFGLLECSDFEIRLRAKLAHEVNSGA